MFTGLVETTVAISAITEFGGGKHLDVEAPDFAEEIRVGDSIAVNGCCLTVVERGDHLRFDLLEETWIRTSFPKLQPGDRVNLERSLRVGDRLGGHFVQGHIDCTAQVREARTSGADLFLRFAIRPEDAHLLISKGSIAVNGVSLTVCEPSEKDFGVWIIPHTAGMTNLGQLSEGDWVNLEFDMLAKHLARLAGR